MATEFITTMYEFNHGEKPRGQGNWAFSLTRYPTNDEIFWSSFTTLAKAKAEAKRHFAKITKNSTIYLLP